MSTSLALTLPWRHRRVSRVLYVCLVIGGAGWLIQALTFGAAGPGGQQGSPALPAAFGLALVLLVMVSLDRIEALLRRLSASSDLGILFDPGQSIDASLYGFARTVRACLEVDECIVVLQQGRAGGPCLYMMDGSSAVPRSGARLDARLADALLALPAERAVLFSRGLFGRLRCSAFEHGTLEPRPAPCDALAALGNLLEARSFVSVPLRSRSQGLGRVYLLSHRRRLAKRHARHLLPLAAQAGPLIENMQLVEKLAQSVATQERRRISRDLHDGTVQPYIGLKLGLEALRRRLAPEAPLAGELDELVRMAADGISQLRSYVGTLSQPEPARAGQESLVHGLRQQVENFSQFYGIAGSLCAGQEIVVPAKLYDELLYIVREGLSNIRRHTAATRASVTLRREAGRLRIEIANDQGCEGMAPFHPHSIAERARELGGRVAVELRPGGETVVVVELPF